MLGTPCTTKLCILKRFWADPVVAFSVSPEHFPAAADATVATLVLNHDYTSCSSLDQLGSESSFESFLTFSESLSKVAGFIRQPPPQQLQVALPKDSLPLVIHQVIPLENMNYIRSRFLNREALHRSNPLNSAENVLR